jgi:hypothetical protein
MALTLPGVLGRIFTATTNLFQSTAISGDAYPRMIVFGDGRVYSSDGTEDLTSGSLVYLLPKIYAKAQPGQMALYLKGNADSTIENVFEIDDHLALPIFTVANAGGVYLSDNFRIQFGITQGLPCLFADVYGHLQLGGQSAIRISAGPPGNNMTFPDATGEVFQRSRQSSQGSWTATNGTYAALSLGAGGAPSTFQYVRQWTAVAAGNIVTITGTGKAGYPCAANIFCAATIQTQSKTTARSKQLALVFYNAAGTVIGSAYPGAAVTDNTTSWTMLSAQAVSPAGTAYAAVQLTVTSAAINEVHYDSCAGWWDGLTSSQITAWNPPYVYRTNAFLPAASTVTGCTGNGVSPIVVSVPTGHPFMIGDSVTTTLIGGNTNANQVNATISGTTSTSFTIPGTGNGAYTSGGSAQMTNSEIGLYDGAYVGDVFIRSDGPDNVVQRFWTNGTAGIPNSQNWVSDPRITNSPSRANWYGGNYLQQGQPSDPDYVLPLVALGLLHNDPPDSVNRGVITAVGSWNLLNDASNAQVYGGQAAFTQSVRKKSSGAPYVSKDGMFCFLYGLWDLANVTSGQGSGVMTQLNSYPSGAVVHTLRDMIAHARASNILPYSNAAFALSGNLVSGQVQYAWSGGGPGIGGTFAYWTATSGTFTFTIPTDFTGGAVTISLLSAVGAFGGVITWSGTLFSTGGIANPGTTSTSNITPVASGSRARQCVRFTGLTSLNAGQTIIGTITSLDSGGSVSLDCAYLEGSNPNLVALFGNPLLPANTGYVNLGGAGSYWNGNSGSTGNGDVTTLNTSLQSLVSEFDSNLFYVDSNGICQQQASFWASDSCTISALGVQALAQQFSTAVQTQLPLINFRDVNHDYHDTTVVPVGGPFSKQGLLQVTTGVSRFYADDYYYLSGVRASVNTAPQGASIIVDVFKNGSTIFTTAGNRPTITAGTFTASSAAPPDLLFVQPGDYLTVNIAQVGTGVNPGADLTVNVLGRKIPIP